MNKSLTIKCCINDVGTTIFSKMLKNFKELAFCRKVLLAQSQLSEAFSWSDKLCSFSELPARWKTSQTPLWPKWQWFWKHWNFKNLKMQILLVLWTAHLVKIYSNTSFDKSERFWTFSNFNNLKMQPLLIFSNARSVKTNWIPLLTKVTAFQSYGASKARKGKLFSFCKQPASWKIPKDFFWQK